MEASGKLHRPALVTHRCPLDKKVGWPQRRFGRFGEEINLLPTGNRFAVHNSDRKQGVEQPMCCAWVLGPSQPSLIYYTLREWGVLNVGFIAFRQKLQLPYSGCPGTPVRQTPMMVTAVFVEKSENLKHSTPPIPEGRNCTVVLGFTIWEKSLFQC
jgi:hypothetical protein